MMTRPSSSVTAEPTSVPSSAVTVNVTPTMGASLFAESWRTTVM